MIEVMFDAQCSYPHNDAIAELVEKESAVDKRMFVA